MYEDQALVPRCTPCSRGGRIGWPQMRTSCQPVSVVDTLSPFGSAVKARTGQFPWSGFDLGAVVIGEADAGDVDAEFDSAVEGVSDRT